MLQKKEKVEPISGSSSSHWENYTWAPASCASGLAQPSGAAMDGVMTVFPKVQSLDHLGPVRNAEPQAWSSRISHKGLAPCLPVLLDSEDGAALALWVRRYYLCPLHRVWGVVVWGGKWP